MKNIPLRQPAVAGRFYSGTEQDLKSEVTGTFQATTIR